MLEVTGLTKVFVDGNARMTAVNNISFEVRPGEVVGFLGPNGAGKTTTIQMLLGLMTPSAGQVRYFGQLLTDHREEILQRINHASGYGRMPWRLTVRENLKVFGLLYSVPQVDQRIQEMADAFQAHKLLTKRYQDLSAGQMTRVMLMKAFINNPELVLLDEPTASLDPDIAEMIREYILKEKQKRDLTLLITSHNMKEVETMCDRVIFLQKGQIYAEDTPKNLAKRNTISVVQIVVDDGLKRLQEVLDAQQYVYEVQNRFIEIRMPTDQVGHLLSEMGKRGLNYSDIEIIRPSLEDFFLSMTKEEHPV